MKICFFGDATEMHLRRWVKEFVKRNCQVLVITLNTDSESFRNEFSGCQLEIIGRPFQGRSLFSRAANLPLVIRQIKRIVDNFQPEVFHSHSASAYAWLPMFAGIRPRMISPWGSDIFIYIKDNPLYYLLTKLALTTSNLVHCDGENTKKALMQLGVKETNIALYFFGTDVDKFKPAPQASDLRENLKIPASAPVIISIRTLTPVHGVNTLIAALPAVHRKIPEAHFLICGDGPLKSEFELSVVNYGLEKQVHFLGRLPEDKIAEALASSNLYVSTSISESGLAGSTAEAMATGLPIINTNTGDIAHWIQDGETGYIIPVSQPDILTEKIVAALQSPEMINAARTQNRSVISERNNIKIQMDIMLDVYRKLAKK